MADVTISVKYMGAGAAAAAKSDFAAIGAAAKKANVSMRGGDIPLAALQQRARNLADAGLKIMRVGSSMQMMGMRLTTSLTLPIALAFGYATKKFLDFDKEIRRTIAIVGGSGTAIRAAALNASRATIFSAQETAQAYYELVSAGWNAIQAGRMLTPTLKFAEAASLDVGTAVNFASSQFHLWSTRGYELVRVMDIATVAVQGSQIHFTEYEQAARMAGGAFVQAGQSLEEMAAVFMIAADMGVVPLARIGFAARRMMNDMIKPTKAAGKEWDTLGIKLYDSYHQMKPVSAIMGELRNKTARMSQEERNLAVNTLYSVWSRGIVIGLLSLTSKQYDAYIKKVDEANGAMLRQAKIIEQSPSGQFQILTNRINAAVIEIGGKLLPTITQLMYIGLDLANWLNSINPFWRTFWIWTAIGLATLGPLVKVAGAFTWIVGAWALVTGKATVGLAGMAAAEGTVTASSIQAAGAMTILGSTTALLIARLALAVPYIIAIKEQLSKPAAGFGLDLKKMDQENALIAKAGRDRGQLAALWERIVAAGRDTVSPYTGGLIADYLTSRQGALTVDKMYERQKGMMARLEKLRSADTKKAIISDEQEKFMAYGRTGQAMLQHATMMQRMTTEELQAMQKAKEDMRSWFNILEMPDIADVSARQMKKVIDAQLSAFKDYRKNMKTLAGHIPAEMMAAINQLPAGQKMGYIKQLAYMWTHEDKGDVKKLAQNYTTIGALIAASVEDGVKSRQAKVAAEKRRLLAAPTIPIGAFGGAVGGGAGSAGSIPLAPPKTPVPTGLPSKAALDAAQRNMVSAHNKARAGVRETVSTTAAYTKSTGSYTKRAGQYFVSMASVIMGALSPVITTIQILDSVLGGGAGTPAGEVNPRGAGPGGARSNIASGLANRGTYRTTVGIGPRLSRWGYDDVVTPPKVLGSARTAVDLARRRVPYIWGGSSLAGGDCSGEASIVAQGGGFMGNRLTSGEFGGWGRAGEGPFTVYGYPPGSHGSFGHAWVGFFKKWFFEATRPVFHAMASNRSYDYARVPVGDGANVTVGGQLRPIVAVERDGEILIGSKAPIKRSTQASRPRTQTVTVKSLKLESGRLEIGGDGLATIIDGRISTVLEIQEANERWPTSKEVA